MWANNPIGVATIEAVGLLGWPADRLKILSIGTRTDVKMLPRLRGKATMATSVARLFMAGQSHSALGTAKIITGDGHDHRAIWRIDQTAPAGRYTLDNASRITEMAITIAAATPATAPIRPPMIAGRWTRPGIAAGYRCVWRRRLYVSRFRVSGR